MLKYQKEFFRVMLVQEYSEGHIKKAESAFKTFEMFLESVGLVGDPRTWNKEVLESYYQHLKDYTYDKKNPQTQRKEKKHFSKSSIAGLMCHLKNYVEYLVETDRIYQNPFEKFEYSGKKEKKVIQNITEEEINKLVETINIKTYAGFRDRTVIELLYGTGLRRGECSNLNLSDLDLKECILSVHRGKGKKDRLVPIGEVAKGFLTEYIHEVRRYLLNISNIHDEALFLNGHGYRMRKNSITMLVTKYARKADLYHITAHKLRHAYAIHLLKRGCDIRYIQELLGHADLATSQRYTSVFDDDLLDKLKKYHPRDRELWQQIDVEAMKRIANEAQGVRGKIKEKRD